MSQSRRGNVRASGVSIGCLIAGAALAELLACAADEPPPAVETTLQPITGGQLATECQWPTTVLLNGCSGTLVHPLEGQHAQARKAPGDHSRWQSVVQHPTPRV